MLQISTQPSVGVARRRVINRWALLETAMLAGLALLFLFDTTQGVLAYYINPRYTALVLAGGIALLVLAAARLPLIWRPAESNRSHVAAYLLLGLPLFFGLFFPAQPLGSAGLASHGIGIGGNPRWNSLPVSTDTQTWTLLDWAAALQSDAPRLKGARVQVVGFVFHTGDVQLPGSFDVARYVVTCCVADSACIGLPVLWRGRARLRNDTWVTVKGRIGQVVQGGTREPVIVASSVTAVSQPGNPYLSP